MISKITLLLVFGLSVLSSIEYSPWTERDLELLPSLEFTYQKYSKVHSGAHSKKIETDDYFVTGGISTSYDVWRASLETTFADTYNRSFGFDNAILSGGYQWFNDIVADFASLVTGVTLIYSSDQALDDFSAFHHGRYEAEGYISIGKEISCWKNWSWRFWSFGAFGIADRGSPWIRGQISVDRNISCSWYVRALLRGLLGFGDRDLKLHSFNGYGSIKHRSLEFGTKICRPIDGFGTFKLGYCYRFYAKNFPENANILLAEYLYPFGL